MEETRDTEVEQTRDRGRGKDIIVLQTDRFDSHRFFLQPTQDVKVKLFLCLIKYHAMKTYWGSGSTDPSIFNIGTGWR
jgi:hypothetical protein